MTSDGGRDCLSSAIVWHMHEIEAERDAEQLTRQVRARSDAGRSVAVFARVCFNQCDQLLN